LYSPYYFPGKVLVKFSHSLRLKWIPYDSYPVSVTFPSISVAQTIKPWRATNKFQPHDGRGGCQLTLFFLHLEPSLNCHVAATTCCWSIRSPTRLGTDDNGYAAVAAAAWSKLSMSKSTMKSKSKTKSKSKVKVKAENPVQSPHD